MLAKDLKIGDLFVFSEGGRLFQICYGISWGGIWYKIYSDRWALTHAMSIDKNENVFLVTVEEDSKG